MVVHTVAEQRDVAARIGTQFALVHHASTAACGRVGAEGVAAFSKVLLRQVQRGSHQPAHVHLGPRCEQDTCGVDQEHLTVGAQAAIDFRTAVAHHAVQRHGIRTRLHKLHQRTTADVEALPVHAQLGRGLRDHQRVAALLQLPAAHHHAATHGQRIDVELRVRHAQAAQQCRQQPGQQA